jgi:glycosyltransferase involved in cell wall biosynthesis
MPARIALVKPDWSIRGGFELVLDRLVERLQTSGHRVDVLGVDAWAIEPRPFGVTVPPDDFERAPQFFRYISQLEQCRLVNARRADAVISTQPPSFAVDHPRHLSIFYHHHRIFYDLKDEAVAAGLVPAMYHDQATEMVRQLDERALAGVGLVLAGSETVQDRLARYSNRSADVAVFHAGPSTSAAEPCDDAPRRSALCISRHDFPKRTEMFVHAMHLLADVPGVSVGAGGRLGFVRQLDRRLTDAAVPEVLDDTETWLNNAPWIDPDTVAPATANVEFRSGISDEEIRSLYRSSFCVVAPALKEDYGLTAIEAMQNGVPVITCSDSGHLAHLIEPGVTGLVVEPTGAALAAAVRQLRDDPELALEMGHAGRQRAREFTWDRAFLEFDDAMKTVLS